MPKQHNSKSTRGLLKQLEQAGFSVSAKGKKGTVKLIPPPHIGGSVYHTHATESAYHQLKRDVAKLYKIVL
jgi:hypothetical protein